MGIARRAGKLLIGGDAVEDAVKKDRARLVLLTRDASPRHRRSLTAAGYAGEIAVLPCSMDEAGAALGKRGCVFALEDAGFAAAVKKTICEEDKPDGCSKV